MFDTSHWPVEAVCIGVIEKQGTQYTGNHPKADVKIFFLVTNVKLSLFLYFGIQGAGPLM